MIKVTEASQRLSVDVLGTRSGVLYHSLISSLQNYQLGLGHYNADAALDA